MSIKNISKTASSILQKIENGKTFPTNYVVSKLEASAYANPGDQLLGNMRDVIKKVASKQSFISQKEIAEVYNRLYGFSNGDSKFRDELSDFLPENFGAVRKTATLDNSVRVGQDLSSISLNDKTELSSAFERVFSLGPNKSFGTYDKNLDKRAIKIVDLHLKSMGLEPSSIKVTAGNGHYILCTASFKNYDFTTSNLNIPVQITSGFVSMPDTFVSNGEVKTLTKESALVEIKNQSILKKTSGKIDFAEQRTSDMLSMPKIALPENMKNMADYETILAEAASGYSKATIQKAASLVAREISMFGVPQPMVKFASASDNKINFNVKVATTAGTKDVIVPVPVVGQNVMLPSSFQSKEKGIFDFSGEGFMSFAKDSKVSFDKTASFLRETDEMRRLSYQELVDRIATGVSSGDLRISEDALSVIGDKFPDKIATSLDIFKTMIKAASLKQDSDIVKEAVRKGILIKRANSIELFCPKLGLPLSKIDFDKNGNPIPKHRTKTAQLETLGEINPMTSKILIS